MALSNDWAQQADVSDSSVCGNVSKKKTVCGNERKLNFSTGTARRMPCDASQPSVVQTRCEPHNTAQGKFLIGGGGYWLGIGSA
jgi:hypothetical protein